MKNDIALIDDVEFELETEALDQAGTIGVRLDDMLSPPRLWQVSGISGDGLLIQPFDNPMGEPIFIESTEFWGIY